MEDGKSSLILLSRVGMNCLEPHEHIHRPPRRSLDRVSRDPRSKYLVLRRICSIKNLERVLVLQEGVTRFF